MVRTSAYLPRLKMTIIAISILMMAFYFFMVVPQAFAGWKDFVVLLLLHLLIYLSSRYWISPALFQASKFRISRLFVGYVLQIILLMGLLVLLSVATGALQWREEGLWDIVNLWPTLLVFVVPNILGFLFFLIKRGWGTMEAYRRLTEQQEVEMNEIQFQFSQHKMWPHFLFNTLATIRYLSRHEPEKSTQAMSVLIDMTKFYLQVPNRLFISLEAELGQVDRFQAIYALRINHPVYMEITTDSVQDIRLPAMLLMNLLENAFQYGVIDDLQNPVGVDIAMASEDVCRIRVCNNVRERKLSGTLHGYGNLDKMRQSLQMLHPQKNSLQHRFQDGKFVVEVYVHTGD